MPHHCATLDEEESSGVSEPQWLALHAAARGALGALIGQSEARTRAFVWNVVVGTGVVLSIATVGTLIGAGALLLDILDLI